MDSVILYSALHRPSDKMMYSPSRQLLEQLAAALKYRKGDVEIKPETRKSLVVYLKRKVA